MLFSGCLCFADVEHQDDPYKRPCCHTVFATKEGRDIAILKALMSSPAWIIFIPEMDVMTAIKGSPHQPVRHGLGSFGFVSVHWSSHMC